MILTGRSLCLPSPTTVQELFFVARDASIIPDISLDPVLTSFLSLDSSAALQHQYAFLQRSMSMEQRSAFSLSLNEEFGGSRRVTYGGVGVVALALSMLFDQVAQQIRTQELSEGDASTQRSPPKRIFGISSSSRIGWIMYSYLHLIPGIANNHEKMAETTEVFDNILKIELLDHYERMTTKKRMSSLSMQQWLTGAAFHLHMRIHQVRLNSVPPGSVKSLRGAYKSGLSRLIQDYTSYLYRNIKETPPRRPRKPRTRTVSGGRQTTTLSTTNETYSANGPFNSSLVISTYICNETATPNQTADMNRICKTKKDFGLFLSEESDETALGVENRHKFNSSAGYRREDEILGLLVIEPGRNVSHSVRHHSCESPAIQQALLPHIMNALDLERNKNFFQYHEKVFYSLLRQRHDFVLRTTRSQT